MIAELLVILSLATVDWFSENSFSGGDGGRSGTIGGRFPGCFSWFLPKRSIPKPDQHRKDITQQESLGTDML